MPNLLPRMCPLSLIWRIRRDMLPIFADYVTHPGHNSITLLTSTIPVVVIRRFVQSASYKSNETNQQSPIVSPSQQLVLTVSKKTLV